MIGERKMTDKLKTLKDLEKNATNGIVAETFFDSLDIRMQQFLSGIRWRKWILKRKYGKYPEISIDCCYFDNQTAFGFLPRIPFENPKGWKTINVKAKL